MTLWKVPRLNYKSSKTKNNKTYSKNEVINQILNETVGGILSEGAKVGSGMKTCRL